MSSRSDSNDPTFLLRLNPHDLLERGEAQHHAPLPNLPLPSSSEDEQDEEGGQQQPPQPAAATIPPATANGSSSIKGTVTAHPLHSIGSTVLTLELRPLGLSFQLWPPASSLLSLLDPHPLPSPLLPLLPTRRPLRLLELGSGTGLPAVAAAALLPASAVLTDLPLALPNLRRNAFLNLPLVLSRGGSLRARPLRWGHPADLRALLAEEEPLGFDLVLASDVVYREEIVAPLLETAREVVKGETIWAMAHLKRWRRVDSAFFRKAKKVFDVEVLKREEPSAGVGRGVVIYKLTEKKKKNKNNNKGSNNHEKSSGDEGRGADAE